MDPDALDMPCGMTLEEWKRVKASRVPLVPSCDTLEEDEQATWQHLFALHTTPDMPADIVARQGVLIAELACGRTKMGPVRKTWVTEQLSHRGVPPADIQKAFDHLRHEYQYPLCNCLRTALRKVKGSCCQGCSSL